MRALSARFDSYGSTDAALSSVQTNGLAMRPNLGVIVAKYGDDELGSDASRPETQGGTFNAHARPVKMDTLKKPSVSFLSNAFTTPDGFDQCTERRELMQLQDILFSQGFGTRRICCGLVQQGLVQLGDDRRCCDDPLIELPPDDLVFWVQGERWVYHRLAYLLLHKPAGTECSQKPSAYPSIYTLLPSPLRMRGGGAAAGVQAVGRLDQDTTGLLLLSDDGRFIHRLTSPRHHVPKVYEAQLKHPLDEEQIECLLSGVVLDDDPKPVQAQAAQVVAPRHLRLTLTEGKYHQVKRMVAAVGNRVEALHRSAIGSLVLDENLPPGQWRWLQQSEVQSLLQPSGV